MRPIQATISLEDARARIDEAIVPMSRTERVALADGGGRVLAFDIVANSDVPPFARAGMDGYAVIAEDTFGTTRDSPSTLSIVETVYTGVMPVHPILRGQAAEIATGAPMPHGADAVVMVEETERGTAATVRVLTPVYPRQNVGAQGADIKRGQVVLQSGAWLSPSRIGALAALGHANIDVFARPNVAVLSTGNEVIAPGAALAPGQIYDINRYTLSAIIDAHGSHAISRNAVVDTIEDLDRAVDASRDADVLVFSGGSSVGERDLLLDVISRRGVVVFHGIAVKPGKPTLFGRIDNLLVFGMPGYPTSCLSNAYMLLIPALRRMAHLPPYQPHLVTAPLAKRVVSTTGRHQFYTVRLMDGQAHPAFKASGDITSMSQADGYIEIPAQTDIVEAGHLVEVRLF